MPAQSNAEVGAARRILLVAAPFVAGAVAVAMTFAALHDALPSRIATHFTADGTANSFSSPGSAIAQYCLIFVIEFVGLLVAAFSIKQRTGGQRSLIVLSWALAAATAYDLIAAMQASTQTSGSQAITLPLYQLAIAVGVGVAAAAIGWLLGRRRA
ncbi:DUF1648 domain-containing protein [Streptomyces halobius]|uniref:DUF1648 domain-containing protein n=1 Tax=Streptomyces halobius TaxID=2879846 RepID=A0ABY4M6Z9_9ACTN|nr:DUF1648 domain-containing protein [Streptomyces halobius]UQA93122.1 DUF1648 domain-containing protein [Streptomyces halobius]